MKHTLVRLMILNKLKQKEETKENRGKNNSK